MESAGATECMRAGMMEWLHIGNRLPPVPTISWTLQHQHCAPGANTRGHGAKHMWRSLGWICDLVALLHTVPELDWDALHARAEKLRVKRALGMGLYLAHDSLDAKL